MFTFNSPTNPRGEANAVKDELSVLISAVKATDQAILNNVGASGGVPDALATAVATSKPKPGAPTWYDDTQLKADIELQQSLMKKDHALHRTYEEARRTKPESISNARFNAQFWSTRIDILRAHAVEANQRRGMYNVLSVIKPQTVDGEVKINISKDQVLSLLDQHPLLKRVYDENVPKIDEINFWQKFFVSRLYKKLKGERITEADNSDPIFDRYLSAGDEDLRGRLLRADHVPHIIDIEGNEENQGGSKGGNRPDETMRPGSSAKAPIIRTLNSLSEKIMAHVTPSDIDPSNPIGMDESTFNELVLRDLQGDPEENRIILNIKEQSLFLSSDKSTISKEAAEYSKQIPADVLLELEADLDPTMMGTDSAGGLDLRTAIGVVDDSDSEEEEDKKPHVGSKSALVEAQKQIFEGISQRRMEMDGSDDQQNLSGLSQSLFDRLTLTHATTTEFLHHFWMAFLSGDPDRAEELQRNVETLQRAKDRINAVAKDAEEERNDIIKKKKNQIREYWEKTGKKMQWNSSSVAGGEKVVMEMLRPTIEALDKATREYGKAWKEQGGETSHDHGL